MQKTKKKIVRVQVRGKMDNLYSENQSCQYENLNSIVVPVLADGRPVPIPTKNAGDQIETSARLDKRKLFVLTRLLTEFSNFERRCEFRGRVNCTGVEFQQHSTITTALLLLSCSRSRPF